MSSALSFSATQARRSSAIHESITQTIGNTPIVRLGRLAPPGVNVYCKLEAANPGGSVKVSVSRGGDRVDHRREGRELKLKLALETYRYNKFPALILNFTSFLRTRIASRSV